MNEWERWMSWRDYTVEEFYSIVEDALTNGFEFVMHTGEIYFRERSDI